MLQFAAQADSLTFTAAIQCVGSGGLTAHVNCGSDKTVLTASTAVPTETATGHWTGGHCADCAS